MLGGVSRPADTARPRPFGHGGKARGTYRQGRPALGGRTADLCERSGGGAGADGGGEAAGEHGRLPHRFSRQGVSEHQGSHGLGQPGVQPDGGDRVVREPVRRRGRSLQRRGGERRCTGGAGGGRTVAGCVRHSAGAAAVQPRELDGGGGRVREGAGHRTGRGLRRRRRRDDFWLQRGAAQRRNGAACGGGGLGGLFRRRGRQHCAEDGRDR